jgi:ribosome-binding factor A
MKNLRKDRLEEELKHLAGRFLSLYSNTSSLLTVTGVSISNDLKEAIVLFTVFPDSFEKTALEFAKRKRSDFKEFVRNESRIARIPHLDFKIDLGEKNRQRIDELSNQ